MAGTTVVFLAHQGHEHISSSQAEWSQITKKTWMLSTHLFFLQAIHHPLYLKHHTPKKRDQSLVTKFHNFHHLDQMFFKSYFPLPPPMVPTLPTLQCVFSPFSSLSLAALGLHFDPAAQTKSCRIPISQQGLKFRPDPAGENPERPVINSSHLEKLSWLFLVRKFYIVPKFPR